MTETPTEQRPMSPSEMADWLEQFMAGQWERDLLVPGEAGRLTEIAAYLRRQPTDAQKIEALKAAAYAAEDGAGVADDIAACRAEPWRLGYARYEPSAGIARAAAAHARAAALR